MGAVMYDAWIKTLRCLVSCQQWELIDHVLNKIDCARAEDGTPEGAAQGFQVGVHVGFLKTTPEVASRDAFKDLVDRYRTALAASRPRSQGGDAPGVGGMNGMLEALVKVAVYYTGRASVLDHEEERDTDSEGLKAARDFYRQVEADKREIESMPAPDPLPDAVLDRIFNEDPE